MKIHGTRWMRTTACCMAGISSATQIFPGDCKRVCLLRRMTEPDFMARSKTVRSVTLITLRGVSLLGERRGGTAQCKSSLDLLRQAVPNGDDLAV